MRTRIGVGLAAAAAAVVGLAGGADPAAAQSKLKDPVFLYGYDLRVRPGGSKNFDKNTPRVGVEVYKDENNNTAVAITETGALAVMPAPTVGADKSAKWLTAHDVPVRKGGEAGFTQQTKKYGIEVFQDVPSGRLLYATETGWVAFSPAPAPSGAADKGPKWHHALDLKARSPDQESFDKATKYGVEVYKDEGSGLLMYVTEAGAISLAAAPAAAPDKNKIKSPKHLYGLLLDVRTADEKDFTAKTKKVGVEVFEDPNTGGLVYISDAGSVAAAPMPASMNMELKGVDWKNALALNARKGGEADWKKAKKFGLEVFLDRKTGNRIYVGETGAISVFPAAK
jgi:hypothetical protein